MPPRLRAGTHRAARGRARRSADADADLPAVVSTTAASRSGIATHYLRYLGANLMVTAAGFVSFPVMTRLLDNHQFGLLGYYEALLLVVAGVLKLGTQHAILRFYPHGGDDTALRRFRSDHVLLPFALSMLLWAACAGVVLVAMGAIAGEERPIVWLALATVPLVIWCSFVEAVMYALERSDITLWLKSAWRWGELALVLATLIYIERSATGVFAAKLAVVAVVAAWLTLWFLRWLRGPLVRGDRSGLMAGLAFGVPMMANELISLVFAFADRLLLRALTGDFAQVGIYTIGYGLAMALTAVLGQTLAQAFTPTAVRLFETRGPAAVVELKRDMLNLWIIAVSVVSALLLAVGADLFRILAGPSKLASVPVFVAVALVLTWYSLFSVAQYGLLLQRRASRFMVITLLATVLNVLLNVPLILAYGVMGAVAATVASYVFLAAAQYWQCPAELRYLPSLPRFAIAVLFPLLVAGTLHGAGFFGVDGAWPRLLGGSTLVLLLALPLVLFDRELLSGVRRLRAQRRDVAGQAA
jgi:O-antigen/teichoic acid export membrane protein